MTDVLRWFVVWLIVSLPLGILIGKAMRYADPYRTEWVRKEK